MTNDALSKLRIPAIGLIITGIINLLVGAFLLLSGLVRFFDGVSETIPTNEAERFGFFVSTGIGYGIGFFSLILAPVIIYGGMKMLKGEKIGLAKTAAILAILPLSSCCFVIGIPFGIWALFLLQKTEVRAAFENPASS